MALGVATAPSSDGSAHVQYSLYVIGSKPRIDIPFESPDDKLAVEAAIRRAGGLAFELWNGNRLVLRQLRTGKIETDQLPRRGN